MSDYNDGEYPKSNKQFYAAALKFCKPCLVLLHQCPKDKHYDQMKELSYSINLSQLTVRESKLRIVVPRGLTDER